jgi:hypothetical protein
MFGPDAVAGQGWYISKPKAASRIKTRRVNAASESPAWAAKAGRDYNSEPHLPYSRQPAVILSRRPLAKQEIPPKIY